MKYCSKVASASAGWLSSVYMYSVPATLSLVLMVACWPWDGGGLALPGDATPGEVVGPRRAWDSPS